jgi:hypothetical protein
MKMILMSLCALMLASVSCNENRTNWQEVAKRQLVVEKFGDEVMKSPSVENEWIVRCPDGSVWIVTTYDVVGGAELGSKTMIFPENLQKMPVSEQ